MQKPFEGISLYLLLICVTYCTVFCIFVYLLAFRFAIVTCVCSRTSINEMLAPRTVWCVYWRLITKCFILVSQWLEYKAAVRWLQISGTFGKLSLCTKTVAWWRFEQPFRQVDKLIWRSMGNRRLDILIAFRITSNNALIFRAQRLQTRPENSYTSFQQLPL